MRPHQIEAWALRAVDRMKAGQPLEDSLLEAKATWIDPVAAARRIAGHCNAAGGAPVLWVIGLDERTPAVPGVPDHELSNWWSGVATCFEGPVPRVTDLVVHTEGVTLVALLFETERAPFVVRNPAFGQKGGGAVEREVPWREGTAVRSARHEDLIRVLSPLAALPKIDLVQAELAIVEGGATSPAGVEIRGWWLRVGVFVTPRGGSPVSFPKHLCRVSWQVGSMPQPVESRYPIFGRFGRYLTSQILRSGGGVGLPPPPTSNIQLSDAAAYLTGPGMLSIEVDRVAADYESSPGDVGRLVAHLQPSDAYQPIVIEANLAEAGRTDRDVARWECLPRGIIL